jgi:hypothetical protein
MVKVYELCYPLPTQVYSSRPVRDIRESFGRRDHSHARYSQTNWLASNVILVDNRTTVADHLASSAILHPYKQSNLTVKFAAVISLKYGFCDTPKNQEQLLDS